MFVEGFGVILSSRLLVTSSLCSLGASEDREYSYSS